MKVLWLCNIMIPFIAQSLGQRIMVKEGWLSGLSEKLIADREQNKITYAICFPTSENFDMVKADNSLYVKDVVRGVPYYMFREDTVHPENYDVSMEESLKAIVEDFQPDIVHIFGTEYPHTLAMMKAFGRPERTLIGIQGLCSAIAEVYMADLPEAVCKKKTFRDMIKKDGLIEQQEKFVQRGRYEQEALAMAVHVTGRTDFDREYVSRINPNIIYHFMNETLREEFYHDSWNIDTIETMLYVAGDVITAHKTLKDKIKISGYGKYLLSQIRKSKMEDHVKFVGALQPDKMCARYLKSHVFLCPSAIENSPNSVGEAMLLGVPTVGANVGGVHNLLTDNKDGFLYQPDKPQQMKAEILRIFNDDKLAMSLSSNARTHAARTHDPDWNYRRLLEIYHEIDHSI